MVRRRFVHVLVARPLRPLPVRRWTAAGDTSTAPCAALDSTAETVDDAGENCEDNHGSYNDPDNNRPSTLLAVCLSSQGLGQHQDWNLLAVRLGHALVPAGERLRSRFQVTGNIACPQRHGRFIIHRTHFELFLLSRPHKLYHG